jgi:excisionase family DNA binding protein
VTNATVTHTQYLRVDEVATTLRMSKMTVYRLIHAGTIPSIRVGRTFRIPAGAFAEYLSGLEGRPV